MDRYIYVTVSLQNIFFGDEQNIIFNCQHLCRQLAICCVNFIKSDYSTKVPYIFKWLYKINTYICIFCILSISLEVLTINELIAIVFQPPYWINYTLVYYQKMFKSRITNLTIFHKCLDTACNKIYL